MIWSLIQRIALIVTAVVVIGLAASKIWPAYRQFQHLQETNAERTEEVRKEQEAVDELKEKQARLRTDPAYAERIAREEHGLAKPGELIVKYVDDPPASNAAPRKK